MSDYFYVDREEFECVQNVALGSYGIFTQDSSGNLLYEGKYIYYEGNLVPGVTDAGLPNHYYTMVNVVGTSWEFDSAPTALTSSAVFNFNFKTNSASYTKLTVIVSGSTVTVKYDDTVCYQNGWKNGMYRKIRIIDGTDASNWQLAAFLIDNAVSITNGTKNISGNISVDGDFNVNGAIKQNGSALISGTKLYKHVYTSINAINFSTKKINNDGSITTMTDSIGGFTIVVISTRNTAYETVSDFCNGFYDGTMVNFYCSRFMQNVRLSFSYPTTLILQSFGVHVYSSNNSGYSYVSELTMNYPTFTVTEL